MDENKENSGQKIYMNIMEKDESENLYNETFKEAPKKKKPLKKYIALFAAIGVLGVGIGAGFSGANTLFNKISRFSANKNVSPDESNTVAADENNSVSPDVTITADGMPLSQDGVNAIKKATKSVVNIVTRSQGKTQSWMGYYIPYESAGAGSGIIFFEDDEKIAIATNSHVVDGATQIGITIDDGTDTIPATLLGEDTAADLAVIAVNKADLTAANIKSTDIGIADFASSAKIEVGDAAIAIGNAMGEGKSATRGIISALGKKIQVDGKKLEVIQTDAAINSGNSGGALVDADGNVIGINTAKAFSTSVEGMGYAIPSDIALPIINQLLTNGTAPKPYLGVRCATVTSETAEFLGIPAGVWIEEVIPDSGADKAGIRQSDIITDFNGKKTLSSEALIEAIEEVEPGSRVSVRLIRGGEKVVTLNVEILDQNEQ